MITRSKLVEQLREYQIRSQHKWGALTAFSPKPQITTRFPVPSCSLIILNYAARFTFLFSVYLTLVRPPLRSLKLVVYYVRIGCTRQLDLIISRGEISICDLT
ncbi:hypothetical protein GW17_00030803 [Ensete ventricosum]|uniref:Uncharacterized protein n=1 Tax=Ensete ventricosum TaxID=4639 RepID=A0A426YZN3_ENSVE|nr:hypothetical protein B296_00033513 [Ensete ventricosum]RWW05901.1 hypothetical protein GW17_00030803 [Ensete ventricosum]